MYCIVILCNFILDVLQRSFNAREVLIYAEIPAYDFVKLSLIGLSSLSANYDLMLVVELYRFSVDRIKMK